MTRLRILLQAGGCLGGLLVLGWLGREGLMLVIVGVLLAFFAIVGVLLAVQYPRAFGNVVERILCYVATRTRALARYHQSGRLGYACEINTPMEPINPQVLENVR